MDKVAVVILTWNGSQMLRSFLPSVLEHSEGEAKVYVADNGSEDDTLQVMADLFPAVNVIALPKNYGFAEGYNRALQEVEADYVVLLNSDVEVTPHWLTPVVSFMDAHPEVAACQPKIKSYRHRGWFEYAGAAGGFIDRYGYPFCRGRIFNTIEEDNGQYDTASQVFWATGACLFIRLKDYLDAGGLDARFFAHMEEIDLCWRLQCRGWKVVCVTGSVVYHVGGGALDYENPRKTYLNFRNNLLMLYKNLPTTRLGMVMLMRFVLDYVAMVQSLLTGKTKNAKAIIDARKDYHKMKGDYKEKRNDNLHLAKIAYPDIISKRSIIFDYYLLGKRK